MVNNDIEKSRVLMKKIIAKKNLMRQYWRDLKLKSSCQIKTLSRDCFVQIEHGLKFNPTQFESTLKLNVMTKKTLI